ncbi:MAG TPA: carboxypeptidase-like regulatory domain-containing protein, partial [Pyrinomonadaceae bacterium]|nr:carboxypeptidase-like regulatory domain-containing protein [Pyrinomonadaceae bacterium]
YFGSDGGIWRTTNVNAATIVWNSLNNSTISASQFMGLAVHPVDPNYLLGGTQDNGTQFLAPDGVTWIRSDGGDGGFAVIDQNATDTTNIVAYHTYFNTSGSQIGFSRALTTVVPGDPNWGAIRGCGTAGSIIANGINCSDAVLFYAPMVGGPNAPGSVGNTLYFGTSRLYRSADQGTTMTDVSGVLPDGVRISAIGIAPQNDDIRLVGTTVGTTLAGTPVGPLFLSTTPGATSMIKLAVPWPARYVSRVVIDPTNSNVAYVSLNGFGLVSGQHVWKTTNLLSGNPTWTAAGGGIPDTPVNALVIDPLDPNTIYAGADIGVFKTSDGGANWIPFSTGLPRVAVFGIAIQPTSRTLRIATHGRGIWQMGLLAPDVSVSGRVTDPNGRGLRNASVTITDPSNVTRTTTTSSFGLYSFDQIVVGRTYTLRVNSRLYRFASSSVTPTAAVVNFDFVGLE